LSPRYQRILVRGVNWLGDAVMTTPALQRLRERYPGARITLLTQDKLADLWEHHPAIDEVLTFQRGEGVRLVGRRLKSRRFDLALLFPNSPRSALEAWFGGVPERVGGRWPWRNWLLTKAVPHPAGLPRMRKRRLPEIQRRLDSGLARETYPREAHQVFHYLRLSAAVGADPEPLPPRLHLSPEELAQPLPPAMTEREKQPGEPVIWLGLNPGAEYGPAKRWPVERFAEVANRVHAQTGAHWLVLGGANDVPLAERLIREVPSAVSVCGKTSLRQMMVVLTHCRLLLTNDTGPMHVAAALDVPVVVPFGSTSPELTGPGLLGNSRDRWVTGEVGCAPYFLAECPLDADCLKAVEVLRVVQAISEVLEGPE